MKNYQKPLRAKVIAGIILAFYFVGVGVYYNCRAVSHHGIYNLISGVLALIIMTTIPALIFINTLRWRLILTDSGIMIRSLIKNRELGYDEIKGYVLKEKTILIIPKDSAATVMTLSNSFEDVEDFITWLKGKYQEIESTAVKEDGSPADAQDTALEDRITQAKVVVYSTHAVCILMVIITSLQRDQYPILANICTFIPFAYFGIYYYYDDVVSMAPEMDSPYPSVGIAVAVPSFAVMTPLVDIHYLDGDQFYPYIFYGIVLFLFFYLGRYYNSNTAMKSQLIGSCIVLILAGGSYGYDVSSWINKHNDNGLPHTYYASVTDMYRVPGKSTSYYVVLSSWGPIKTTNRVSLREEVYNNYQIRDRVEVSLHQGALGIPWYTVNQEKDE